MRTSLCQAPLDHRQYESANSAWIRGANFALFGSCVCMASMDTGGVTEANSWFSGVKDKTRKARASRGRAKPSASASFSFHVNDVPVLLLTLPNVGSPPSLHGVGDPTANGEVYSYGLVSDSLSTSSEPSGQHCPPALRAKKQQEVLFTSPSDHTDSSCVAKVTACTSTSPCVAPPTVLTLAERCAGLALRAARTRVA